MVRRGIEVWLTWCVLELVMEFTLLAEAKNDKSQAKGKHCDLQRYGNTSCLPQQPLHSAHSRMIPPAFRNIVPC